MPRNTNQIEVVEVVEVVEVKPVILSELRPLSKEEVNGYAAYILSEYCATDIGGKYVLPSGPKQRVIEAALVSGDDNGINAFMLKAFVYVQTKNGLRAFLSEYTTTKGLFPTEKKLKDYLEDEKARAISAIMPVRILL